MKRIGIIGFGNMGSAIAERIKKDYDVQVFDQDAAKTVSAVGIGICSGVAALVDSCEAIILAIKPQDFESLLACIKPHIGGKTIISIAAGVTTGYMERMLGEAHVIRVMPNLAAQIGEGVSGLYKGRYAGADDLRLARELLSRVGIAIVFDKEEMIDAVTAVSGSGPAYFCYYAKNKANAEEKKDEFIQKLSKAAEAIGFDNIMAKRLAERTTEGTISVLIEKHLSCEELIKRVASKGGTTEAALGVLDKGGSLEDAVKAALARSKELSRE